MRILNNKVWVILHHRNPSLFLHFPFVLKHHNIQLGIVQNDKLIRNRMQTMQKKQRKPQFLFSLLDGSRFDKVKLKLLKCHESNTSIGIDVLKFYKFLTN